MATVVSLADYGGGGGGGDGPYDPRDVAIFALLRENAEFRVLLRRLLDVDGPEAGEVIAQAERLLAAHDTIEREDEDAKAAEAYHASLHCYECGALKGAGTSYCPECDAEALARLKEPAPQNNVTPINLPF